MIRIIFRVTHQYNSRLRNKDYLQVAAPKTANLQEHWIRAPLHSKKKMVWTLFMIMAEN